ncbi:MAG: glycosyl transferase [Anaerolinea sp.]|nr:glycosyl transferase [Anaerolinea sp.]
MRILHVIANLSPERGGPPKTALELSQALARLGHEVSLYTTNADGQDVLDVPTDRPVWVDGVTVHYFPIGCFRRWGFSGSLGKALCADIPSFDVVHIHSLYLFHTFVAAHYCRHYGVPYLIRPHGTLDPFLRRKSRLKKAVYNFLVEKRSLDNAAAIHYTSQGEMDLGHDALKIRAPGVVVPLGLDVDEYSTLPTRGTFRARFPEIGNKFLVLFLGRINFVKGLDLLARAYGVIARQRQDVHLIIAGPDEEGYGRRVQSWLVNEGVLERVTFAGMLRGQDKLAAFADADVFVLPSYTESFGMAVVEAMACGLPVVISNKVNIWREVAQAEAGLVVNCDSGELADALLKIMDDPELKEHGEKGKHLVQQRFTWERVASQMLQVYQAIQSRAETTL